MMANWGYWSSKLEMLNIPHGTVVALEADFSPTSVAIFLALIERDCIVVPLSNSVKQKHDEYMEIAKVQVLIKVDANGKAEPPQTFFIAGYPELYQKLHEENHAGLVVFSSGSTGDSKAIVHDMTLLLKKFDVRRQGMKAITFLLFDHLGGINTMMHLLATGGCMIIPEERTPDHILNLIEEHKVELLPTSPTFLNMILVSEAYKRYNIESLKLITYGTEPMYQGTLNRFQELYPNIKLKQTYGLSEIGVMGTKSQSSKSLWVKVGGDGYQTRVVDDMLEIKAESAMLGYLNAPSPFTEDGWLITNDKVEVDGEYMLILGRESDIINVGGEKVYPAEVESVIKEMGNIAEVTAYGEGNPLIGELVSVDVTLIDKTESLGSVTGRIRDYTKERLAKYKRPMYVSIVDEHQHGERFKKRCGARK